MAVEDRGRGAWERKRNSPPQVLGKRTRQLDQPPRAVDSLKRKLRRSASSKMGSQSDALWAGITAVSMDRKRKEEDDWTEEVAHGEGLPKPSDPVTLVRKTAGAVTAEDSRDATTHDGSHMFTHGNNGIFRGRVVFPYGFDAGKVIISLLVRVLDRR